MSWSVNALMHFEWMCKQSGFLGFYLDAVNGETMYLLTFCALLRSELLNCCLNLDVSLTTINAVCMIVYTGH